MNVNQPVHISKTTSDTSFDMAQGISHFFVRVGWGLMHWVGKVGLRGNGIGREGGREGGRLVGW